MILSKSIMSRDGLAYTLDAEIKQRARAGDDSPIRILVPQDAFTRGVVGGLAHKAYKDHGVALFTSFVKVDGITYWVIQEDTHHAERPKASA